MKIKNSIFVILGTLILSFGSAVFILPFNIVAGGVSGAAIIISKIFPFWWLSTELAITALTWLLFLVGLAMLGVSFALKTFLSSAVYPIGVALFSYLARADVLGGYFYLIGSEHTQLAILLAAVMGGAMIGVGCALSFMGGGSTGGFDIAVLALCKLFPGIKSSVVMFSLDAVIIIVGAFVTGDIVLTMLGIICALVCSLVIDKMFLGASRGYVADIVSDEHESIARGVVEKLGRTATVIDAMGAFSGERKKIVRVSFSVREYATLFGIVMTFDPKSFITVQRAHEISGEGWTR